MPGALEQLVTSLTHYTPSPEAADRIAQFRKSAIDLAHDIDWFLDGTESRERSLAHTHLEEVVMWTERAIIRLGAEHEATTPTRPEVTV